jgi:hypothetical protein
LADVEQLTVCQRLSLTGGVSEEYLECDFGSVHEARAVWRVLHREFRPLRGADDGYRAAPGTRWPLWWAWIADEPQPETEGGQLTRLKKLGELEPWEEPAAMRRWKARVLKARQDARWAEYKWQAADTAALARELGLPVTQARDWLREETPQTEKARARG